MFRSPSCTIIYYHAVPRCMMLKFAAFTSEVEFPFWATLASQKIENDKLDDAARGLLGVYEIRPRDQPESSCRIQIHSDALTSQTSVKQVSEK